MHPIIFIRHGESQSNKFLHDNHSNADTLINSIGDPELTDIGLLQAQSTSLFLRKKIESKEVRVYTSGFKRAQQTASAYSDNITVRVGLNEYTHPKKSLTEEDIRRGLYHHVDWSHFTDVVRRECVYFTEQADAADGPIIIFGHSLWISTAIEYLSTGLLPPTIGDLSFELPNCSISVAQKDGKKWRIFQVGSVAHLPSDIITGCHTNLGYV